MAAGLGFKTFNTGDVLSAADTNGYLMQGVLVFADATARTAAITSPEEGQVSFLKDTNSTEFYDGSAWVAIGGGSSPLTTKGDLYTYSTTDARLAVGANGTTLVADSAEATGLKWATASSGGMTLLSTTPITTSSTTITGISTGYKDLQIVVYNLTSTSALTPVVKINNSAGIAIYVSMIANNVSGTVVQQYNGTDITLAGGQTYLANNSYNGSTIYISEYSNSGVNYKPFWFSAGSVRAAGQRNMLFGGGVQDYIGFNGTINLTTGATCTDGYVLVYGVK